MPSIDLAFISSSFSRHTVICTEILVKKFCHGVLLKWSRYQDTIGTYPFLQTNNGKSMKTLYLLMLVIYFLY